jgi:hypothetical protein
MLSDSAPEVYLAGVPGLALIILTRTPNDRQPPKLLHVKSGIVGFAPEVAVAVFYINGGWLIESVRKYYIPIRGF